MTTNHFSDPVLQKTVAEAVQIESFIHRLDQVSADIRRLETWLSECGVCVDVWLDIGFNGEKNYYGELMSGFQDSIGWTNVLGKWRLVFCRVYSNPNAAPDMRPLIDMPAATRLEVSKHLPRLVRQVAKLLPSGPHEPLELPGL